MDVEGLLNLEDHVAPQTEKQIAKKPKLPEYQMDPNYWDLPPPPEYTEMDPKPLQIKPPEGSESPAEEVDGEDEGEDKFEGEEDEREANKILDKLQLPNYDDVEKRLAEPDMTSTRQRNYLNNVLKNVDKIRRQVIVMKSNATKSFKAGKISEADKQRIHNQSDKNRTEINDYVKHYK